MDEEKRSDYCVGCKCRKERTIFKNGRPHDFNIGLKTTMHTNIKDFCSVGWTQNPATARATRNVINNGGMVCEINPFT